MDTKAALQQLQEEVFAKQKVLADIFFAHGRRSVFEFSNSWSSGENKLGNEMSVIIRKLIARSYGDTVAQEVTDQLKTQPLVSTIDHHGILNHPFFINSNLIYSLRKDSKYLVVFSTAGISLNNSSWPGCLFVSENGNLARFSLFPDHDKTRTVLWTKSFGAENIAALKEHIGTRAKGAEVKDALLKVSEQILGRSDVLGAEDFCMQSSLTSSLLWEKYFPQAPHLITVPVEDLVSAFLSNVVNGDPSHLLHQLMYTEHGWNLLEKHFDGWLGAFSHTHKGSFLFWGLGEKGRRIHLHRQGENLVGEGMNIRFHSEVVNELLEQRQIYPTSLLCFLVLLWYKFTCLGGFNQVNWLTDIKMRFVGMLKEMREGALADGIGEVVTSNFAESNLAFIPDGDGIVRATGMDLLARPGVDWWQSFIELSKTVTVGESLLSQLPEIYRVITPGPDRRGELLTISDEQAATFIGLSQKVRFALGDRTGKGAGGYFV